MVINNIYLPNFWQRNVASAVKKKSENISTYLSNLWGGSRGGSGGLNQTP